MGSDAPYILIAGTLVQQEMASGRRASRIAMRIGAALLAFVDAHTLGEVYGADGTFILQRNPDTVLVPDAAFVRADRLPPGDDRGFVPVAPDLAVEAPSPSNRPAEIARKVALYLAAGTQLVWVVDPDAETVTVHAPDAPPRTLSASDTLDGDGVLSGFTLPLAGLLAG